MKILICLLAFFPLFAVAQSYGDKNGPRTYLQSNTLQFVVYTPKFESSKAKLQAYLLQQKYTVISQTETKSSVDVSFKINPTAIDSIEKYMQELGYVYSKNLNSTNNSEEYSLEEAQFDLSKLKKKLESYKKMQMRLDSLNAANYYTHFETIIDIEGQIAGMEKRIIKFQEYDKFYIVKLNLYNESSTTESTNIKYVHLPGAEYVFASFENPRLGTSAKTYQGVNLKYIFTKGKSYFSIGALKANGLEKTDSTTYDDLFNLTFGQDWYSRNLGRGKNKFLNPYIGYQTGLTLAFNQNSNIYYFFVNPTAGIELFKNDYLLLDINAGYNVPISNYNRDFRAWRFGASLNFSF